MKLSITEYADQLQTTRTKVEKLFGKWMTPLYLRNWQRIHVVYNYEPKTNSPDCAADCDVKWEYMSAVINVYLPVLLDQTDDQLEYTVVHELAHLLVNQLRDMSNARELDFKYEEFVVTRLAMALICVRDLALENHFGSD